MIQKLAAMTARLRLPPLGGLAELDRQIAKFRLLKAGADDAPDYRHDWNASMPLSQRSGPCMQ